MLSCLADDLVHLYKDLLTAKAMWDDLQKKVWDLVRNKAPCFRAQGEQTECTNNKGIEKHRLNLSACFT